MTATTTASDICPGSSDQGASLLGVDERHLRRGVPDWPGDQKVIMIDGMHALFTEFLEYWDEPQVGEARGLLGKAHRQGIAGFTPAQLLTLVLVWLVLLAEPEVVLKLHPAVQEVANGEVGTVDLAVALTVIMAPRRSGPGKKD
jgi:hypothetical protein